MKKITLILLFSFLFILTSLAQFRENGQKQYYTLERPGFRIGLGVAPTATQKLAVSGNVGVIGTVTASGVVAGTFASGAFAATTGAFSSTLSVDGLLSLKSLSLVPVRGATEYWYAHSITDADPGTTFSSQTPAKTYMYYVSVAREATQVMTGDSRDVLYKGTYGNYAVNDASSNVQGIGINLRNRSAGTFGLMNAAEFGIKNDGIATTLYGGTFTVEHYGTFAGTSTLYGLKIDLRNEGSAPTNEAGLYITNTNNSLATAVASAVKIADAGANIGWTTGIDMSGATISRAIVFPTAAAADTTVKTAGAVIYLANVFYGCNGTFWYKMINP